MDQLRRQQNLLLPLMPLLQMLGIYRLYLLAVRLVLVFLVYLHQCQKTCQDQEDHRPLISLASYEYFLCLLRLEPLFYLAVLQRLVGLQLLHLLLAYPLRQYGLVQLLPV